MCFLKKKKTIDIVSISSSISFTFIRILKNNTFSQWFNPTRRKKSINISNNQNNNNNESSTIIYILSIIRFVRMNNSIRRKRNASHIHTSVLNVLWVTRRIRRNSVTLFAQMVNTTDNETYLEIFSANSG